VVYMGEHRRYAKDVSAVSVAEPGSFLFLLLGLVGIGFLGLRRV
jgi:hypothetical protein